MNNKPSYEEIEKEVRRGTSVLEACRFIVESTNDSIYLVDGQCRYLLLNKIYCSRLGLPLNELRGRNHAQSS